MNERPFLKGVLFYYKTTLILEEDFGVIMTDYYQGSGLFMDRA